MNSDVAEERGGTNSYCYQTQGKTGNDQQRAEFIKQDFFKEEGFKLREERRGKMDTFPLMSIS